MTTVIWKILLAALTFYVMLCAFVFLFQRRLLYLPDHFRLPEQRALNEGLRYWPSFNFFQGFTGLEAPGKVQGTVIVFHGNAGAAYHRDFYVEALSGLGYRVILAEYPGYGGRAGQPSEQALVEDALDTIQLAHESYSGEPVYLWGESLGCGVAAGALSKTEVPIQGVVLFLPWDTLPKVAQTHYPYLPARWLALDQYNNIENLKGYDGRIAVLLAEQDEVVPVQHGQKLYESITTEKRLWTFASRHNEVPVSPHLDWWGEVMAFVAQ